MAARLHHVPPAPPGLEQRITAALRRGDADGFGSPDHTLRGLIATGLDRLPRPGHGETLKRWQCLERVARHDLALVKLYESHTDALAILQEIDARHAPRADAAYAVWASESRTEPLTIRGAVDEGGADGGGDGAVVLDGRKSWCSGARVIDVALMTARDADGARWLVEVHLSSAGIAIDDSRWAAVGMRDSGSYDVVCDGVAARVVGATNAYLDRPGFWHGGAGVAACWYGGAAAIGERVRDLQAGRDDVHALWHLGSIDCALACGRALLREFARQVDARPADDASRPALRVRSTMADIAETVVHHAGRAIGPGPLCNEPRLARLVADLPVFIRQCRAEHDLVAQARALLADAGEMGSLAWAL